MTSKSKVLRLLEQNRGTFLSGEALAGKLEISRSGVWKAINELKKEGYAITAVTNKGYCLETSSDLLSKEGLAAYLPEGFPMEQIQLHKVIDSTNNEAKRLAVGGAPGGTVVLAEEQSGGKGRLGRSFYSPPGSGIYLSVLLRPNTSLEQSVMITTATSVCICRAIEAVTGKHCDIKWVNDVYCEGKKVCGILTEAVTNIETGMIDSIVVGIGINFRMKQEDFPEEIRGKAGALYETDTEGVTRNQLAAAEILELSKLEELLESGSYLAEYRSRSIVLGRQVQVVSAGEERTALVEDIDETGGLVVRWADDNSVGHIRTGEVSIRGLFQKE